MATKICEACGKEVGDNETKCPACGVDFEALEQECSVVERAMNVLEKRRKAKEPSPPMPEASPTPEAKRSIFRSLGRK